MVSTALLIKLSSVKYHNRYGGICPNCKATNVPVTTTRDWLGGERLRYHHCECGNFTSIEEENALPIGTKVEELKKPIPKKKKKNTTGSRKGRRSVEKKQKENVSLKKGR